MKLKPILFLLAALLLLPGSAFGQSTDFDGADSIVTVPHVSALATNAITFACWTYREGNGENDQGRIADKSDNSANHEGWRWSYSGGNYALTAEFSTTDGSWTATAPSANNWVHVALIYDGSSTTNEASMYFNGVNQSVNNGIEPVGTYQVGTRTLAIGNNTSQSRTWDGQLADCAHYNRILSVAEINQVMHRGPNTLQNGLVGFWPMGGWGGLNFTATASLDGTPTGVNVSTNAPPISRPAQGWLWD